MTPGYLAPRRVPATGRSVRGGRRRSDSPGQPPIRRRMANGRAVRLRSGRDRSDSASVSPRLGTALDESTPASPARRPPGMNRRTALLSSLFLGGLVPPSLLAQEGSQDRPPAHGPRRHPRPEGDDEAGPRPPRTCPPRSSASRIRAADLGHLPLHQHPDQRPGPSREGADRLDPPPHRHRRMAWRPPGRPLGQPQAADRLQLARSHQAGGRDRRAIRRTPPTTR